MKTTTLKNFIKTVGDKEAAALFKVKPRTVQSWRLGDRSPRGSKQLAVIIDATRGHPAGAVTYEGIYSTD